MTSQNVFCEDGFLKQFETLSPTKTLIKSHQELNPDIICKSAHVGVCVSQVEVEKTYSGTEEESDRNLLCAYGMNRHPCFNPF